MTHQAKYKPSGYQWLEIIPSHWQLKRIKDKTLINVATLDDNTSKEFEIKYLDISNVESGGKILDYQEMNFEDAPSRARRIVKDRDIALSTVRPNLQAIAYLDSNPTNLIASTGFAVIQSNKDFDPRFLYYFLYSEYFKAQIESKAVGVSYPAVNSNDIGQFRLVVPPIAEQQSIVKYLDDRVGIVDKMIQNKNKQIETLKQFRMITITNAVLKGIDGQTETKESGTKWIGKIPKNWQVKRLKDLLKSGLSNGIFKKSEEFGEGLKLVNVVDLFQEDFQIKYESLDRVKTSKEEYDVFKVEKGDIFFVRSSLKLEGIACASFIKEVPEETVFDCHIVRAQTNPLKMDPFFLINYLNSSVVRQHLIACSNTVTMTTISQPKLSSLKVVVPPISEQIRIADYIAVKSKWFREMINNIEIQIDKLSEYRKVIINDVVTGKIKITN
ncbi:MAG: restriction endonuclease subunit S [Bacteroidota bacterium]|nr:restriction endonuclease subunit S [Bacteroidota bacterium]